MFWRRKKPVDYGQIERLEIELGIKEDPHRPDKLDTDRILPPLMNGRKIWTGRRMIEYGEECRHHHYPLGLGETRSIVDSAGDPQVICILCGEQLS